MSVNLRLPNTIGTEKELRSYLYQLVQELQYAFDNITTISSVTHTVEQTNKGGGASSSVTANDVATFNTLKSLIIKSADIVNAYYEEISSRLDGQYVAESTFGEYVEQTTQIINQSSTRVDQVYENYQQILTDIENVSHTLAEVNAYIRSGLLYYNEDGIPIYGLEIGQRSELDGEEVFNKFARFTADRLEFFDKDDPINPVAYISNRKLYITHAEITGSLILGGFVKTVIPGRGVVTKWVGTGG